MKKLLAFILACVVLSMSLAACKASSTTLAPSSSNENVQSSQEAAGNTDSDIIELSQNYTFRWGHSSNTSDANHLYAEYFAQEMSRRTNGKVQVEIYPSGLIGTKTEMISYVMDGSLEFCNGLTDGISQFLPSFKICDLPYLVSNYDEADAVFGGPVGDALIDQLKTIDVIGLGWGENGFREVFNNIRPIESAKDMTGLKIRSMETNASVLSFQSWGVDPTVMAWTEVYSGLQQGTVDGADGPAPLFFNAKMNEVVKYMSTTNHFYTATIPLMSKKVYDSLPENLQALILEVGAESADYMKQLNRDNCQKAIDGMVAGGLVVNEVSDDSRAELAKMSVGVYAKCRDEIGAEFFDWAMEQLGINWK